jgi:hypothetical protein
MFMMSFKKDCVLYLQTSGSGNIKTTPCCPGTDISCERMGPLMEAFVYSKYKFLIHLCILVFWLFLQMKFLIVNTEN